MTRERAAGIDRILSSLYPDSRPLLSYRSPFELLVAVILSAQCTDDQVNRVTPDLFAAWPDAPSLASARIEDVERAIRSVGFYRVKARHIVETARLLGTGPIPDTIEGLLALSGVGRKTASLVASAVYGIPGIIVDTHVLRVAARLGISSSANPVRVERDIGAIVNRKRWTAFSHELNRLGKLVCVARAPRCGECPVAADCPSREAIPPTGRKRARMDRG